MLQYSYSGERYRATKALFFFFFFFFFYLFIFFFFGGGGWERGGGGAAGGRGVDVRLGGTSQTSYFGGKH